MKLINALVVKLVDTNDEIGRYKGLKSRGIEVKVSP